MATRWSKESIHYLNRNIVKADTCGQMSLTLCGLDLQCQNFPWCIRKAQKLSYRFLLEIDTFINSSTSEQPRLSPSSSFQVCRRKFPLACWPSDHPLWMTQLFPILLSICCRPIFLSCYFPHRMLLDFFSQHQNPVISWTLTITSLVSESIWDQIQILGVWGGGGGEHPSSKCSQ